MHKMKFFLPRIFGLAIITGIGAILLAAISKILILIGIVGAIITFSASRISRRREMQQQYGMQGGQGFSQMNDGPEMFRGRSPFHRNDVSPVGKKQNNSGIIPIN